MRAVLDACVIYPTVMREALLSVAATGAYVPAISRTILAEWQHAAARDGSMVAEQAKVEKALLLESWPEILLHEDVGLADTLYLPDLNDRHVLALAVSHGIDTIVTANLKDFPKRELGGHGVRAIHPDTFLMDHLNANPDAVLASLSGVVEKAKMISGQDIGARALFRKARLPRTGKALEKFGSDLGQTT